MKRNLVLIAGTLIIILFSMSCTSEPKEGQSNMEGSIEIPELLKLSLDKYDSLESYIDSVQIETIMKSKMMDNQMSNSQYFAFKKPAMMRSISESDDFSIMSGVFSDGDSIMNYMNQLSQYIIKPAPQDLGSIEIAAAQNLLVSQVIFPDPSHETFLKGVIGIEESGGESISGISSRRFDMTRTAGSFMGNIDQNFIPEDMEIEVSIWVGEEDYLIRRISYEMDMEGMMREMMKGMMDNIDKDQLKEQEKMIQGMKSILTENHFAISIDPELDDSFFKFDYPENAKRVDEFDYTAGAAMEKSDLTGKPAPDFELKSFDGDRISLAGLKGKVVLVDFWATWCGPCIKAMPHVQELWDINKEKDVIFLGVNSWEREPKKVKKVLKDNKIKYTILLDEDDKVIGKYGVTGIPTLFIIDKSGIIRYSYTGMPGNDIVQENLDELLAE